MTFFKQRKCTCSIEFQDDWEFCPHCGAWITHQQKLKVSPEQIVEFLIDHKKQNKSITTITIAEDGELFDVDGFLINIGATHSTVQAIYEEESIQYDNKDIYVAIIHDTILSNLG